MPRKQKEEFDWDELDKEKEEPIKIEKVEKEKKSKNIFPYLEETLEEFHKKREIIKKWVIDNKLKFHYNYIELGETGLLIYQGSRDNRIAKFKWREADIFYKTSFMRYLMRELPEVRFYVRGIS